MAIKKITLTEDHLRLISNIKFEKFTVAQGTATERFAWGNRPVESVWWNIRSRRCFNHTWKI